MIEKCLSLVDGDVKFDPYPVNTKFWDALRRTLVYIPFQVVGTLPQIEVKFYIGAKKFFLLA